MESSHLMTWRTPVPTVEAQRFEKGVLALCSWTDSCSPHCLGVNVNQGRGLDSPLHAVARASSGELVSLLLDFGADTQARNAEGKRPLEVVPPESPLIQLLQREGASPLPKSKP